MFDTLTQKIGLGFSRKARLDRFYRGVQTKAFAIAMTSTKSESAAMDIVQEAMLRHLEYYFEHDETQWAPLFFKVLASQVANWGRRQALTARHDSIDDVDELVGCSRPQQQAIANQQLDRLRSYLHRLSEREYQVLVLRQIEGYSTKEAAKLLECSEGTIKTLLSRAKAKLDGIEVGSEVGSELGDSHEI